MRGLLLMTLCLGACLKELPSESKTTDDSVVSTDDTGPGTDDSVVEGETCTFYVDGDGDGYGDANAPVDALCDSPPEGLVSDNTDCDDFNVGINPAGIEVCDDLDNDCDGEVDGPAAVGAVPFYADTDDDGYGDATVSVMSCEAPEGYADNARDCSDFDAAINPDAVEVCDGLDNNCDLLTDGDDAVDRDTWTIDGDGDLFGDDDTAVLSCYAPDTSYVSRGGDCDDTLSGVNPSITGWATDPYNGTEWDYNCDTVIEQQYPDLGSCTVDSNGACVAVSGFQSLVPECGLTSAFINGCDADCLPQVSISRRQKCR